MQVESDIPTESTSLKEENPREDFAAEKQMINGKATAAAQILVEEMELVEKSPVGYRLSKAGASAMSRIELLQQQHKPKGREYTQLLQTYIPLNVKAPEVMRPLIGRWFKNLRWIGMIRSDTGYTLQWTSDDGSFQIN